jgi:hypothetical protein
VSKSCPLIVLGVVSGVGLVGPGFCSLAIAHDADIYSQVSVMSSSEAVPVLDMISGWDGPFQAGEYAYADGRIQLGFVQGTTAGQTADNNRWFLEWEQRWHYDLRFSKGMSRYYQALEQGTDTPADEKLMLDARTLQAQGLRFGQTFLLSQASYLRVTPALALYRVSDWQFGHLSGVAEGGASSTASAVLDYHYNEDKILEYGVDPAAGRGVSLDLGFDWQPNEHWQVAAKLTDIWNQWRFEDSGYTDACINFNNPSQTVCSSKVTASGKSGQEQYRARILPTLDATAVYAPWNTRFSYYQHSQYRRVGAEYQWMPMGDNGLQLGVAVYSTAQLGVSAQWHGLSLLLASDDLRSGYARDMQVKTGLAVRW